MLLCGSCSRQTCTSEVIADSEGWASTLGTYCIWDKRFERQKDVSMAHGPAGAGFKDRPTLNGSGSRSIRTKSEKRD